MGQNAILVDWMPDKGWEFEKLICRNTGMEWVTMGVNVSKRKTGKVRDFFNIYMKYFTFPFLVFLQKGRYENIIAWQQFFGIILSFYLRLAKARSYPRIYIMTFIYKRKKGLIGKIYHRFMKYSVESGYVSKLFCYSKSERDYYLSTFNINPERIVCVTFGIPATPDIHKYKSVSKENFFLSAGRSNRDYQFLIDSLKDSRHKVEILCDELNLQAVGGITVHNNVFGEEYIEYMARCYAVIIPLKDENISAGQLVLLRAMELGKPVIATDGKTVREYIVDGENGIIVSKTKESLKEAVDRLAGDESLYRRLSGNAVEHFHTRFSLDSFARSVAKEIRAELGRDMSVAGCKA